MPTRMDLIERFLPRERWRRNQIAVTGAASLVFFGFTLVLPFLPYYVESLGVQGPAVDIWSGIILSVAPFMAAIMAPVWGRLAENTGLKLMAQRTMLAMLIHWIIMLFASSIWHLLVLRILLGAFSGFGALSVALVTAAAPRDRVGESVGTLQSAQIFSAATGPFIGGVLYDVVGLRATFGLTALLCAGGLGMISLLYRNPEEPDGSADGELGIVPVESGARFRSRAVGRRTGFRSILSLPGVLPIIALLFWVTLVARSFNLVVPLIVRRLTPSVDALGLVNGVTVSFGSYAEALSAFFMGRLAARRDPRRLLLVSLTVSLALVLPMPFVGDTLQFLFLRVLLGLAAGGAVTLCYTMGAAMLPERGRTVAFSVLSSAAMLGGSMGPIIAGLVSWGMGLKWNFAVAALIYAALAAAVVSGAGRGAGKPSQDAGTPAPPPSIAVPR